MVRCLLHVYNHCNLQRWSDLFHCSSQSGFCYSPKISIATKRRCHGELSFFISEFHISIQFLLTNRCKSRQDFMWKRTAWEEKHVSKLTCERWPLRWQAQPRWTQLTPRSSPKAGLGTGHSEGAGKEQRSLKLQRFGRTCLGLVIV